MTRSRLAAAAGLKRSAAVFTTLVLLLTTSDAALGTGHEPPFNGSGLTLVSGFPTCLPGDGNAGPTGAVDDGVHLYVVSYCDQTLYRFALEPGQTLGAPQLSLRNGFTHGLTIQQGHYYGDSAGPAEGSQLAAGVYEFNPNTLAVTRTVYSVVGSGRPRGLTADPLSGDIYVCLSSGQIMRIATPATSPVVTTFVSSNERFDGCSFSPNGQMLYVATQHSQHVWGYNRSGALVFNVDDAPHGPDGIAVAPGSDKVHGLPVSNNVFVNNNDGTVTRIDTAHHDALTTVWSGGTRGDLAFVDSKGYLDISQSSTYIRLTPSFFGHHQHGLT